MCVLAVCCLRIRTFSAPARAAPQWSVTCAAGTENYNGNVANKFGMMVNGVWPPTTFNETASNDWVGTGNYTLTYDGFSVRLYAVSAP